MTITAKEYDEVDLQNLSQSIKTQYGIGFCYFDPETETLLEFDNSVKIPVLPYESTVKRFYLVKDSTLSGYNTVTLTISTAAGQYKVKNKTEKDVHLSFDTIPDGNCNLIFLSEHCDDIIGIDVYIESSTYSYTAVSLSIEIEVN